MAKRNIEESTMLSLNAKRIRVFMVEYFNEIGYMPTQKVIREGLDLTQGELKQAFRELEAFGYMERKRHSARAIKLQGFRLTSVEEVTE